MAFPKKSINAKGKALDDKVLAQLIKIQRTEITEHHIYRILAAKTKNAANRRVLEKISQKEHGHNDYWKSVTHADVKPSKLKIFVYVTIAYLFGLTFGLRFMEHGEELAQKTYKKLLKQFPKVADIIKDEHVHEQQLLGMINEEKLEYTGSIVLGLNDALVELTGSLAGLTLALQNTKLVSITGLIVGIAAALSMAASEYLSKSEEDSSKALKSSTYTGMAYIMAVMILVAPYFLFKNPFFALGTTFVCALLIIFFFTFYISVAKNLDFKKKFLRMAMISIGVAAINFVIGLIVRKYLHVDV